MSDKSTRFSAGVAAVFRDQDALSNSLDGRFRQIKAGEVLVKTRYTTLCGSDIHTYCGRRFEPPQVVLGHEIAGDILYIDDGHSFKDLRGNPIAIGDRITWSIFSVPTGAVAPRPEIPQKSNHLFKYGHSLAQGDDVFNGGLADYCILRQNTAIIKISPSLPLKIAATISCAHSTVAGALRTAGDIKGRNVIIFGAGLLGLSCVAMCREAGAANIGMVDTDPSRLQWATKFGADFWEPFQGARAHFSGPTADVVFDMTGQSEAMLAGLESLRIGGCAIWIGAVFPGNPVPVDAQNVVRKLLQIRGLHNYNYGDFLAATDFIENNHAKYPFGDLVEKEFMLSEIEAAFSFAAEHKPVRVGIKLTDQVS